MDIFDNIDILDYIKNDNLEYLTINYKNNFMKYVYDSDNNTIELIDCIGTICLIDKDVLEELFENGKKEFGYEKGNKR